jgi:hypothetical protein
MTKKTILITMCIIMMLFANKVMSQVVADGTIGDCTWELTGTPENYTLTISGSGAMEDYPSFLDIPWVPYRDDIAVLDLQQGVTSIGDWAFSFCNRLTSLTIPNSVIRIGEMAFTMCEGLISVTIGSSIASIESGALSSCINLTSIDVEANNLDYSSVDGVLFSKLQDILVQYPAGKTGVYAIPNSVTYIKSAAFTNCRNLTLVTIPNSVTAIESNFGGCLSLTDIEVEATNPNYSSVDGVLFNKLQDTLTRYPAGKTGAYIVPNSVTAIESGAFSVCINLTSVTIGSSVTSIGLFAFGACSGLTELHVKAQTPPTLEDYVFLSVSDTIPLYVPCEKKSTYQASDWNYFSNIIEDCSGIPVETAMSLQIYPNPATDQLRIKNYELREGDRIECYNMLGRPQLSIIHSPLSIINVSHLPNGVYLLHIVSDNKVICAEKFVIAR